MSVEMQVRAEADRDRGGVRAIHERAFGRPDEAELVEALRGSAAFVPELSLVAVTETDAPRGHILFTRLRAETGPEGLALAPMAVDPPWQRSGIGSLLVRDGLARASRLGWRYVVVLGHAGFYPRFGFTRADGFALRFPAPVPAEVFLALALAEPGLEGVSGRLRYAPEFGLPDA